MKYLLIFNLQNIYLLKCYLYTERFHSIVFLSRWFLQPWGMSNIYGQKCLFQTVQSNNWLSGNVNLVLIFVGPTLQFASVLLKLLFASLCDLKFSSQWLKVTQNHKRMSHKSSLWWIKTTEENSRILRVW